MKPAANLSPTSARLFPLTWLLPVALLFLTPMILHADSGWLRFPGADSQGYVADGQLPSSWSDDDYRWRQSLGSRDVGSPTIVDGKVYLMVSKPDQQQIAVESFDLASGKRRWSRNFAQQTHHLHKRNTFASSTPTVDTKNVFVAWADSQHTLLKCFDHDGNEIWSRDFGSWTSQHGFGTSPRIHGDLVILLNSQQAEQLKEGTTPGQSRMIAVDRTSGKTVWETPLLTKRACYGVPAVFGSDESTQIIGANTGNGLFGLSASDGKMLWNQEVFEMRVCSTPLVVGDIAIGTSGSGGGGNHLVAVRIPKSAGEKPKQLYRIDRGAPYVPTPVVKDGRLFMIDEKGIASCVDIESGKSLWLNRVGGKFGASPIVLGDKMLVISLDGEATVLRASDKFEKLGSFDLGGPVGATPAYSLGNLLLRVGDELRCLSGPTL